MAIIPITSEHIDTVTINLHPKRTFSSSSNGVTGSVYVFANRSPFNRQRIESSPFDETAVDDTDYESVFQNLISENIDSDGNIVQNRSGAYANYLDKVNTATVSPELNKFLEVIRFEPSFSFTSNTLRKNIVKDILFDFYKIKYPRLDWSYTNYHSLNFFTGSEVSDKSALIYPAPKTGTVLNQYVSTGSFTVSFWVNPRRTLTEQNAEYNAGTILHSSSSYAVSIVTGSRKNDLGYPSGFRVMLQLSSSADKAPSKVDLTIPNNTRSYPNDLIYLTPDNSLSLNRWSHVTISWSPDHNYGTGSIWIDSNEKTKTNFILPSSSINTSHTTDFIPLIVGNYYNGPNTDTGIPQLKRFFNTTAAADEGVQNEGVPTHADFRKLGNKPNAEISDIRIYNKYLAEDDRQNCMQSGPENLSNMLFYLPLFFTKESPRRKYLTTPFAMSKKADDAPFNTYFAFDQGGHDLNIENYTRDFVNGIYPRHFQLTSSAVTSDVFFRTANDIMWELNDYPKYWKQRQLLVLPNDNGKFAPNFSLLESGSISNYPASSSAMGRYIEDSGLRNFELVSLREMIYTGSLDSLEILTADPALEEAFLEKMLITSSFYLQTLQRTQDADSNEVVFFDISNLFYGNRILPNTFTIEDTSLTGSSGIVKMKLKDDGMGNIYRCDSDTPHAKWSSVGNILYEEGIVVIKSPNIPLFGKDNFTVKFRGDQNVHTHEVNVILSPNLFTSSSNSTFTPAFPDDNASTIENRYIAFNSVLLHDDNLNVISRTNFAQPVIKKLGDKYLVRIKMDY